MENVFVKMDFLNRIKYASNVNLNAQNANKNQINARAARETEF